jgi:hypothetical protein
VRPLLLRSPWFRRVFAAVLGLSLGFLLVVTWSWWQSHTVGVLATELREAFARRDAAAIENLFCWEGVDAATRSRLRLVIQQEHELPVASVVVRPLLAFDRQPGPGLRPNLTPAAVIEVTFATTDRLSAAYLVGRDGLFRHRLVVMLPAN